jgi:hypothetical protein
MVLKAMSKEDDSDPEPLEKARPLIHVGKLSWYEYAVNELFVVILPLGLCGGNPVCAFWQWTKRADGQEKYNMDAISTQTCDTSSANKFHFMQENYYTFNCEVDESNENLKVTMSNPAGESVVQTPLAPQEIVNRSDDGNGRRRKRALLDYTAKIENDLDDVVMCTFSPSPSSSAGKVLAVGGFGLAFAGFVPMVLATTPPIVGWAVAIASAIAASAGVVDVKMAAAEPTTRPLFPGDVTSNTSSGGFIQSANNISVLHLFVKDAKELTIRSGKASDVNKDVDWKLSSESTGLKWETIFTLEFPNQQHIVSYRGLRIQSLQPAWKGKSAGEIVPNASPTDYALSMGKGGTDTTYYDLNIPAGLQTLFRIVPDRHFVVTQSLAQAKKKQPTGDYTILPLPNGHVLVRVNNCMVTGNFKHGDWRHKELKSGDDLTSLISRNPDGVAYVHKRNVLFTYLRFKGANITVTREAGINTYFLVPGMHVTTRQLVLDGK